MDLTILGSDTNDADEEEEERLDNSESNDNINMDDISDIINEPEDEVNREAPVVINEFQNHNVGFGKKMHLYLKVLILLCNIKLLYMLLSVRI